MSAPICGWCSRVWPHAENCMQAWVEGQHEISHGRGPGVPVAVGSPFGANRKARRRAAALSGRR